MVFGIWMDWGLDMYVRRPSSAPGTHSSVDKQQCTTIPIEVVHLRNLNPHFGLRRQVVLVPVLFFDTIAKEHVSRQQSFDWLQKQTDEPIPRSAVKGSKL